MTVTPFESLIPSIRPKWKRTIETTTSTLEPLLSSLSAKKCEVCEAQSSKYTCPKCSIAYCSLDCYKHHGESCTEKFYQKKVADVLELERKNEDGNGIQEILNRVHQHQQQDDEFGEELTTLELERIQQALEAGEENVKLSPELQAAFERDIQGGQLNHLVQPWSPWWLGDIGLITEERQIPSGPNLDDRILEIPHFSMMSSKPAPTCLKFNIVSIIESICQTLRLYGGLENAQLCVESAETVVTRSPVLCKDERFESMEELMLTQSQNNSFYLEDTCRILANQRHITHALLDGIDILKAATAQKKLLKSVHRQSMKRIRKKLEFYLSWSQGVNLAGLSEQMLAWHNEWKLADEIQTLRLS